jgi:hypothetical protein
MDENPTFTVRASRKQDIGDSFLWQAFVFSFKDEWFDGTME